MNTEQMRKDFEAWANGPEIGLDISREELQPSPYTDYTTAWVWDAWQAALATQPQAPQGAVTDAERSELEELRFYKRVGFPYTDHSTMFDKDHCGYIAMMVPAHLPNPEGEGTVMGKVIHGYTVADVYAKAKAHMAEIEGAAPETPEGKK